MIGLGNWSGRATGVSERLQSNERTPCLVHVVIVTLIVVLVVRM
jgi:hypothetical protein